MRYAGLLGLKLLLVAVLIPAQGAHEPQAHAPSSGRRWMIVDRISQNPHGDLRIHFAEPHGTPTVVLPLLDGSPGCAGPAGLLLPRSNRLFEGLERILTLAKQTRRHLHVTYKRLGAQCIMETVTVSRP